MYNLYYGSNLVNPSLFFTNKDFPPLFYNILCPTDNVFMDTCPLASPDYIHFGDEFSYHQDLLSVF